MKKIGVLTFHRPINYGAFLQAFSLSTYLQTEYPDAQVELIDYTAPMERKKVYINALRALKHDGFSVFFREIAKIFMFRKSAKAFLALSPVMNEKKLLRLYEKMAERYDAVFVGSDAILNWNQNGYPSAYYLNYPFAMPLFTYAASVHGMDFETLTEEQKQYVRDSFARFSILGVRDSNTERFVKSYCPEADCVHTCDPTVFIDTEICRQNAGDVKGRLLAKYGFSMDKPYLVLMLLDDAISQKVKERYGKDYQVVSLFKSNPHADIFLHDLNPFEWVEVLAHSSLTVTQYFHGALLSLRHEKSVVVIDQATNTDRFESKLHDLMHSRFCVPELYLGGDEARAEETRLFAACDLGIKEACQEKIRQGLSSERASMERFMARAKAVIEGEGQHE